MIENGEMLATPAKVECRSEHEYAQRPVALRWEGARLDIEVIEASYRTPEGKRFRVQTKDDQRFDLLYRQQEDKWQVQRL